MSPCAQHARFVVRSVKTRDDTAITDFAKLPAMALLRVRDKFGGNKATTPLFAIDELI